MNRRTTTLAAVLVLVSLPTRPSSAGDVPPPFSGMVGIRACGVSATNPPAVNTANLQKAIDTARHELIPHCSEYATTKSDIPQDSVDIAHN